MRFYIVLKRQRVELCIHVESNELGRSEAYICFLFSPFKFIVSVFLPLI